VISQLQTKTIQTQSKGLKEDWRICQKSPHRLRNQNQNSYAFT